ncbi:MAG: efflux RND transporter periplasmic adaptor subunit [Treponema sp.]|jgi:multidrug efflux pump subunit AcrA (membrane-fusion protein)|nr:efflux RND transporter periplasmic adaptor subunit [Treponema sp.]
MNSKKKAVFIVGLTALIAVGFIFVPSLLAEKGGAGGPQGGPPGGVPLDGGMGMNGGRAGGKTASVFSVRTAQSDHKTLQAYIEINGNIVAEQQVSVVPDAAGKLVSLEVQLGSSVRKGQIIAQVDPSRPGTSYSLSPVSAPIAGIVVSGPVAIGSTVTTGTSIMTIAASNIIQIEANIPEREIGQLKTGLKAIVTLEAFPVESFNATITQVSPVVDPVSRTKRIILNFDRRDSRINPGMFARMKLKTRVYANVISIPSEALTEFRGINGVYIVEASVGINTNNTNTGVVRFIEVESGVSVDGETEIRSGLTGNEKVVIQGQQFLTDGAAVRIIGGAQ